MADLQALQRWLDGYVEAWRSNDAGPIGRLFADDVTYRYNPFDEPLRGKQKVVDSWLQNPDDPESWEMRCEPLAVNGDLGVARCLTSYRASSSEPARQYSNIFVVRLDEAGRATDFTEWFVTPPRQRAVGPDSSESAAG